jgi:hypothetical protein
VPLAFDVVRVAVGPSRSELRPLLSAEISVIRGSNPTSEFRPSSAFRVISQPASPGHSLPAVAGGDRGGCFVGQEPEFAFVAPWLPATEVDPPNDAKERERFRVRVQKSDVESFSLASFSVFGASFRGISVIRGSNLVLKSADFSHCTTSPYRISPWPDAWKYEIIPYVFIGILLTPLFSRFTSAYRI